MNPPSDIHEDEIDAEDVSDSAIPVLDSPSEEPRPAPPAVDTPVDPAVVTANRWIGMVLALGSSVVVLFSLTIGRLLGGVPPTIYWRLLLGLALPAVALSLFAWWWPAVHYRHLGYRIDRLGLSLRKGVVWRKTISIPTTRVQHIDVTQGPLQRVYGLATLTIHTAGTQGASIPLAGLAQDKATDLRDHLLPNQQNGQ